MVNDTAKDFGLENDPSLSFGKLLAHPVPGEEIVISGMSGVFPLADNIDKFKDNLYNKVDMISYAPPTHPEMPAGFGMVKEKSRFDAGFFGIHPRYAKMFNLLGKVILEKCYECILDAGLHPSDFEGTNTGFFVGNCFSEYEIHQFMINPIENANIILGNEKDAVINAVSKDLKLSGPCIILDTACSSGAYALEAAFKAIRMGECDAAFVAGSNFILSTGCSLQFARLGVLNPSGQCRPFDEDGRGYVRSEATVILLLQKAKDSNRIYAKLLHTKTNCDGFKEEGITYPSGAAQLSLFKEIYFESNIPPSEVSYLEAHGTGTVVGDPEEINAVDEFFTTSRKLPLLIGSVKSSIGHSEPTSMLCSIVKVLLAFESNIIAPNINYKKPRKNLKGIIEGRIKVVVENTPFQDENGLAGVSSFGFGGGNAHVILKRNPKLKINNGQPSDDLPRLVCVSGRTEEAVNVLLDYTASKFDVEHIALIHNSFRKPIKNQLYRGYVIVSKNGVVQKSVRSFTSRKSVILYFSALARSSGDLLHELLNLQALLEFRERTGQFLHKKKSTDTVMKNSQFFTDLLIQLAFAELLRKLNVSYETVLSHSVGKFTSAYFHNFLTLEQVLECAFVIVEYLENGAKTQKTYQFKKDFLRQQRSQILSKFKQILNLHKTTNGYGNSYHESPSHEVYFEALLESSNGVIGKMKTKSLLVEVGQTIPPFQIKRNSYLNLTGANNLVQVLESLGSLYEYGQQLQIQSLYPQVDFPVSRGTPMTSSFIKWKHDKKYFIPNFTYIYRKAKWVKTMQINLQEDEWSSIDGHVIDGRILFPATGYLFLAWTLLSEQSGVELGKLRVVFENCKFLRACQLSKESKLYLDVMIQISSGRFEISENSEPVMTGTIKADFNSRNAVINEAMTNGFDDDEDCLNSRDIYKELRLRGYNYKGKFKSLLKSNQNATKGTLKWQDDWIAFMDNMLQIGILGVDSRLLYVPTGIERVTIDPQAHLEKVDILRSFEHDKEVTEENPPVDMHVTMDYYSKIIKSGAIEFQGLQTSSIPRKKTTALPVLEKYNFIPNVGKLPVDLAVRVCMQVALENNCGLKVTAVEVADDATLIGPIISEVLGDQPLVHADVTILSSKPIECDVKVENKSLKDIADATVVVGRGLLNNSSVFAAAVQAIKDEGFLISRESLTLDIAETNLSDLEIFNAYDTDEELLLFLRKKSAIPQKPRVFINATSTVSNFDWLENMKQEVLKKDKDVIVWCQGEPVNGLIGLVNCIRREPECEHVRGLFIVGEAPPFNPLLPFYQRQLDRGLGMNVFMNGTWGTYRHLPLADVKEVESEHCYANSTVRGDLSSIKWIEGPLSKKVQPQNDLVEVFYSALNFRDVMTASGRINVDVITKDRREQECVQGFEFSGKTLSGKRVMGMLSQGTLATLVEADQTMLWNVPDTWTLKEAASVPVVYGTCLYALVVVGRIRKGESILIHSGTGGIGQAAINLCLNMGCTVFTTVGTEEKRAFIKKHFPQINENHIGNSRDLNFERMVMKQTNGKGVELVLNSLAEEKLFASVRCLAKNGRFLEIGKFDLANDNRLNLLSFKQGASYHGVMLDKLFSESDDVKRKLNVLVQRYIDSGAIKPLPTTVFDKTEVEQAFRFMTTGRHMGKVLVEIRNEEENTHLDTFKGLPRYFCDPAKTYIICGGLGGFGLELADWLVLRGCKNLVLTSRKGLTTGYQKYRVRIWKSYGCHIKISTKDITTRSGCEALIKEANALAPVKAIFNLAVVLRDAILQNQTQESFQISFGPKAYATQYLDEISRRSCPDLRDFVVFSSVSCGRGNAGQTNYGMSNSVMERICEKRRQQGYPALAIQWGAIGDVGLVADLQEDHIELEIGGTLQQSIANCLKVLDVFLRQDEATIVSSIVVAEKKSASSTGNIMEVVAGILGIHDMNLVSKHSTLAELGMDSMNAVEVKQTLEREYNIILSPNVIRSLTLARIQELQEEGCSEDIKLPSDNTVDWTGIIKYLVENEEQVSNYIRLKSNSDNIKSTNLSKIIAFPGIEGVCYLVEKLTQHLEVEAYGVNFLSNLQESSYPNMAERLLPTITELLKPNEPFHLLAHSMGTIVALEVASHLERLGYQGKIFLIDGSPAFIKELTQRTSAGSRENFVLAITLRLQLTESETQKIMEEISKCSTMDEKIKILVENMKFNKKMTKLAVTNGTTACLKRLQACDYTPNLGKLKSKVWLYKPKMVSLKVDSEDYDLSQYFENPVEIKVFDGSHVSILENQDLIQEIMRNITEPESN